MIEKNCKKKYQCIYFIDVNLINGRAEDSRGATLSLLPEVDVNHKAQGNTTEEVQHSQQRRKHDNTCPPDTEENELLQ